MRCYSRYSERTLLNASIGLMISGLAQAYQAFQNPNILDLATGAADFIHEQLYKPDTKILLRSYCSGPSAIEGFLDDYRYYYIAYDATRLKLIAFLEVISCKVSWICMNRP